MFGYNIFNTAFGFAAVLFQKDPFLVKQVFLPCDNKRWLIQKIQTTSPAAEMTTAEAKLFCNQIQAYFEGIPVRPKWELLDMSSLTPLQQGVLRTVGAIPYGQTKTYGQIARQIGRPKACRFIGATMHRNPIPVVIPCHRVVLADGSVGGFGGGVAVKKRLLALEKMSLNRTGC